MSGKQEKKETDSPMTSTGFMTERELKDMLNRGAKPSDSKESLEQFVRWRIQQYNVHKWTTLSDDFADDFKLLAREDFEAIDKDAITALRNCLRANSVYIKKGRFVPIAQSLAEAIQEEIPWPEDDDERPPPKQQRYPPQQQQIQPQMPYRPENTAPLPPQL